MFKERRVILVLLGVLIITFSVININKIVKMYFSGGHTYLSYESEIDFQEEKIVEILSEHELLNERDIEVHLFNEQIRIGLPKLSIQEVREVEILLKQYDENMIPINKTCVDTDGYVQHKDRYVKYLVFLGIQLFLGLVSLLKGVVRIKKSLAIEYE